MTSEYLVAVLLVLPVHGHAPAGNHLPDPGSHVAPAVMSATTSRRRHDFRRVTDTTPNRASDGDTLYRMPSHLIDNLCNNINLISIEITTVKETINHG